MEVLDLNATPREGTGKSSARKLRSLGSIPAVLYGPKIDENVNVALSNRDMVKLIHKSAGGNLLLNLKIEGVDGKKSVMFKEVLRDPVKGAILHVDLMEVSLDQKIVVAVPIHVFGKPKGVEAGGKLHQELRIIHLLCLPTDIPQSIDLDISGIGLGETIHVKDVILPAGIEAEDDGEHSVITVSTLAAAAAADAAAEAEEEQAGGAVEEAAEEAAEGASE